jgi:hypothetical protein
LISLAGRRKGAIFGNLDDSIQARVDFLNPSQVGSDNLL